MKEQILKEFDEKFSDNVVWWQECLAEMRIGDPDFNRLKSFIALSLDKVAGCLSEKKDTSDDESEVYDLRVGFNQCRKEFISNYNKTNEI